MREPDGRGPGCMLYPIDPNCETQPLITIADITLRNITSHGGLLPPGIIRCNETNACHGINFENVQLHGIWRYLGGNFIVENAYGTVTDSKPKPAILQEGENPSVPTFFDPVREITLLLEEFFYKYSIEIKEYQDFKQFFDMPAFIFSII